LWQPGSAGIGFPTAALIGATISAWAFVLDGSHLGLKVFGSRQGSIGPLTPWGALDRTAAAITNANSVDVLA